MQFQLLVSALSIHYMYERSFTHSPALLVDYCEKMVSVP